MSMTPEDRRVMAGLARVVRARKNVTQAYLTMVALVCVSTPGFDEATFETMVKGCSQDYEGFAQLCDRLANGELPILQDEAQEVLP